MKRVLISLMLLAMCPVGYERYEATAYSCGGITTEAQRLMNCPNGITASGTIPVPGKTVACAKNMLGKTINIYGIGDRICEDTSGRHGDKYVDIYMVTVEKALNYGRQQVYVRGI